MQSADFRRAVAEMLRLESKTVETYLDYAKRYADLVAQHADHVCAELWPQQVHRGLRLIVTLPLSRENPDQLKAKLEAVHAKAKVCLVVPCPDTMTVYVFGPQE